MEVELSAELTVECAECGANLECEIRYKNRGRVEVSVEPCEECLKSAKEG